MFVALLSRPNVSRGLRFSISSRVKVCVCSRLLGDTRAALATLSGWISRRTAIGAGGGAELPLPTIPGAPDPALPPREIRLVATTLRLRSNQVAGGLPCRNREQHDGRGGTFAPTRGPFICRRLRKTRFAHLYAMEPHAQKNGSGRGGVSKNINITIWYSKNMISYDFDRQWFVSAII